jgi:tetratricopeptide (TPR) repeat protein
MFYMLAQARKRISLVRPVINVSLLAIALPIALLCSASLAEPNPAAATEQPTSSRKKEDLQNVEQLISQAETAEENQKYDEAEQVWKKIIELQPDAVWAVYRLGSSLSSQEKYDEAIAVYRQISQNPNEARAYHQLGATLIARNRFKNVPNSIIENDFKQAIQAYGQSIELQPDFAKNLDWWSKLSPEKMFSIVHQEFQGKPNKTAIDYLLLWSISRNYRRHLEAPGFARKHFPVVCQTYRDVCRDNQKADPEQEINILHQAIRLDPKLSTPYEMLGIFYYEQQQYSQAIEAFEKSIEISPNSSRIYYHLGDVLLAQNKSNKAIHILYQASQSEPHNSWFDYQFWVPGLGVSTSQPRDKTIAALIDELNQRPSSTGYYILGNLFANQDSPNHLNLAVTAYENAAKLDPTFAKAYERLGFVLAGQKKLREAEEAFRKAIQLDPKSVGAYMNLRRILRDQRRFDDAFQVFLAEQGVAVPTQPNKTASE